jgi:hypothetical protein
VHRYEALGALPEEIGTVLWSYAGTIDARGFADYFERT